MKVNGIDVVVCQMEIVQVDDAFIAHDVVSGRIIMFNQAASIIWSIIIEHEERNLDICTHDVVARVAGTFAIEKSEEGGVWEDAHQVIADFFDAGILRRL